jgi:polar amino acid transport system substrate-binding protein
MPRLRRCLLAACLLYRLPGAAAESERALTLCYEDVSQRPWSMPDATGLNFELLRRVESLLGEHFVFSAKPWKRCMQEVQTGQVDAVIAAADASERRRYGVFPTLADGRADPARALFEDNVNVFLRVGGAGSWDGVDLHSPHDVVAVPSGYLIGDVLRQRGYDIRDPVKSAVDTLRMLANGSYDVAVLQGNEAAQLAREDPRFRDKIRQATPPYATVTFYLMAGRSVYDKWPHRFDAIWQAIGNVRRARDYRALENAAGVVHLP